AADARIAVPQACRDARAERGHDQQVFVVHEVLAGQDLHRVVLEVRVVEEERGFARLARLCLQLVQARAGGRGKGGGEGGHGHWLIGDAGGGLKRVRRARRWSCRAGGTSPWIRRNSPNGPRTASCRAS